MSEVGECKSNLLFTVDTSTNWDTTIQAVKSIYITQLFSWKGEAQPRANPVLQQHFTPRRCNGVEDTRTTDTRLTNSNYCWHSFSLSHYSPLSSWFWWYSIHGGNWTKYICTDKSEHLFVWVFDKHVYASKRSHTVRRIGANTESSSILID